MIFSSPPAQTLYLLNQLFVSFSMLTDLFIQNYRQWVLLRERIAELTDPSSPEAEDESPADKALRWLFKQRDRSSKRLRAIKFALCMAAAALAYKFGKKAIDR